MKRWYYLLLLCVFAGCLSPIVEDEEAVNEEHRSVNVLTRSTSPIQYPLTLYAFDADKGVLVASKIQHVADDELSLQLSTGNYYLVALAGVSGCNVPSKPTLSSLITVPSSGFFSSSLQMGRAALNVIQNTTMSITLNNQLAAVNVSFCDIPAEAESVTAHFYPMVSGLSLGGDYSGSTTIKVPLEKEGDMWNAPLFYTLPNEGPLHLTVIASTPNKIYSYGYALSCSLNPNTPYVFSGSIVEGVMTNGSLPLDGWNETEYISFTFGDVNEEDNTGNEDDEVLGVEELPEVGTLWNGHFVVAYGDSDDETNRILLLSTMEWRGVTSATHEDTPAMAADIASTYTEGDFSDWRIPTRDEVRKMCAASGDMSLDATNECLRTNGIAPLGIGDDAETGDAIRYLCDEAAYSFRWDSDGKPSAAGRKRTYHLRLVRTVEFAAK